jgi:hypothetical protein
MPKFEISSSKVYWKMGMAFFNCNPSSLGGGGRRSSSSRPACANLGTLCPQNNNRCWDVAQVVEHLSSTYKTMALTPSTAINR